MTTTTRAKYTAIYERDKDGWWVATVKEIRGCHTQGRSIGQARERIREALELFDVPKSVTLKDEIRLDERLTAELRGLREKRAEAERLQKESQDQTRRVAARLAKTGLSVRDVGELLGVSHQRVQQLVKG